MSAASSDDSAAGAATRPGAPAGSPRADTAPEAAPASSPASQGSAASPLRVPRRLLTQTFEHVRACGRGRAECQVLWIGPWSDPTLVTEVVHPTHRAHRGGFVLDDAWLTCFWLRLAERGEGIRAQVHTHPGEAFHSATDDAWPVVHLQGFLSLVLPDFGLGAVGLERTYLAEIGPDGEFHEVDPRARLTLI